MCESCLDVPKLLTELAASRPLFHSEADFQHALAWLIHHNYPSASVRLEMPAPEIGPSAHLDVLLSLGTSQVAIELKYKTRFLDVKIGGEPYRLKDQSAQDHGRYDFLADVSRLEKLATQRPGLLGYALLLTNDSAYWKQVPQPATVDAAFRISDGRKVAGSLAWDPHASDGTRRNREEPINLAGHYSMNWRQYSTVAQKAYGEFQYLILEVAREDT